MSEFYRQDREPRTLYRSRRSVIFGVCRGLAAYMGISAFWMRVAAVLAALLTGFWPAVIAYIVAAIVLRPEPVAPIEGPEDREFYNSYAGSRAMALDRLKRAYDRLDRRIQRMESVVTSKEYDWNRRFNA